MIFLKQSTAADVVIGPFVDDTDGKTAETALTISQADCKLTKNGGAAAQKSDATAASHLSDGHYKVPLNTTDTNTLGRLRLVVNESGALPAWMDFMVVPANVWDSLFGADYLQVDMTQIVGAAVNTSTAQLGVNAVQAGGTAWGSGAITAASIAADAITAAKLAADAGTEIANAVWNEDLEFNLTPGTAGAALDAAATDVWDMAIAGYGAGTTGEALEQAAAGGGGGGASAEAIADAVWDELLAGHLDPSTAGASLNDAAKGTYVDNSATAGANLRKLVDGTGLYMPNVTIGEVMSVDDTVAAHIVGMGIGGVNDLEGLQALAQATVVGTVVAGTNTTTVVSTALPATSTGFYVGKTFIALSGANAKQGGKLVTGYDGATRRLTIEALTAPMAAGDKFTLVG